MKYTLVTGASGQLGNELRLLTKKSKKYIFTDVAADHRTEALDICNAAQVEEFIRSRKIDVIINCAAYTNVDGAESNPELCHKINVEGVKNLAVSARRNGAALLHISTDYVFDGKRKRGAYKESCTCSPASVYGETKRRGELAIRRTGCRGVIIRTAWLYSPFGKNFVKTMLRLGAERSELGVVADQIGTPTYAKDLAAAILKIVPQIGERRGEIYHFTDEGVCSWFDFAAAIMAYSGLKTKVKPLTTGQYPTPAKRPAYSVLDKTKIRESFGVETPWWSLSLKDCLKRMEAGKD